MRTSAIFWAVLGFTLLFAFPVQALFGFGQKSHTNSIGMEFVLIPAGSFSRIVGENDFGEPVYSKATINNSFYLGKYEVTQEQWKAVMGTNPSYDKGRTNPVDGVSWDDVQKFINTLNAKEGKNKYRLPSEVEWEFASRGGKDSMYCFFMKDSDVESLYAQRGKLIDEIISADKKTVKHVKAKIKDIEEEFANELGTYAWFSMNSDSKSHPVGQKKPNPYGLYDIYGNVWEWVQDWYAELPKEQELKDYSGPAKGSFRVLRGGSWGSSAFYCRSDIRYYHRLGNYSSLGFRLAISPE
jgi:formylglycine-generating enzyme required for sulfatase activity